MDRGGDEQLPFLLAQGYLSDKGMKLNPDEEYSNLRKLPECLIRTRDPLYRTWLIGKETLQGPRKGG